MVFCSTTDPPLLLLYLFVRTIQTFRRPLKLKKKFILYQGTNKWVNEVQTRIPIE